MPAFPRLSERWLNIDLNKANIGRNGSVFISPSKPLEKRRTLAKETGKILTQKNKKDEQKKCSCPSKEKGSKGKVGGSRDVVMFCCPKSPPVLKTLRHSKCTTRS